MAFLVHCFQVKFKVKMLVFVGGRKTGRLGEKEHGREPTKNSTFMWIEPWIEPRPQRRGERAHNRAGHVSDLNLIIVPCSLTVGYGSTKPESLEVRSLTDRDSYFSWPTSFFIQTSSSKFFFVIILFIYFPIPCANKWLSHLLSCTYSLMKLTHLFYLSWL